MVSYRKAVFFFLLWTVATSLAVAMLLTAAESNATGKCQEVGI